MTDAGGGIDAVNEAARIVEALRCGTSGCSCRGGRGGASGIVHCPGHDDRRASLSVGVAGEKVLVRCHAGCSQEAVLTALRERDLWPKPGGDARRSDVEVTYLYRAEDGAALFEVCRLPGKRFAQRRPGASDWGIKGVRRVLYRLPEILAADREKWVFVCEGEKDVDRLGALGLVATTNPGGAGKWRSEWGEALRGRRVFILPDNDVPGRDHALQVASGLQGIAAEVRVLALPGLADKGDLSDWLDAGGTVKELLVLAAAVPLWEPPQAEPQGQVETGFPAAVATPTVPAGEQAAPTPGIYPRSDSGNGELLAALYGDRLRYDWQRGRWLRWAGQWWSEDAGAELTQLGKAAARHRYHAAVNIEDAEERRKQAIWALGSESRQRIDAALALARAEAPITDKGGGWDLDPWLLGVGNGVLDLREGKVRAGRQADAITAHTDVPFDAAAECPRWLRFLDEIFVGDVDLIEFVQRAAGYSLTGHVHEQVWILCHGTGSNGKGTFLNTLLVVLGSYGHVAPFSMFELETRSAISNDVAALVGKRLVMASETVEGRRLNEGRMKMLSGSDPVTARFLYSEHFSFNPVAKFWLACNHKPRVTDDSFAFWRRVRLVPFTRRFEEDREQQLADRLRAELPGVLAWAVQGAIRWQVDGLKPPASVLAATRAYEEESDLLGAFIGERCVIADQCSALSGRLYKEYETWAEQEGMRGKEVVTATTFGKRLKARFDGRHTDLGWRYKGIGLHTDGFAAPDPDGLGGSREAS